MTTTAPSAPQAPATRHFTSRPAASFGFKEVLYAKADGVAVLVLTGAGDRAFSTGADLKEQE